MFFFYKNVFAPLNVWVVIIRSVYQMVLDHYCTSFSVQKKATKLDQYTKYFANTIFHAERLMTFGVTTRRYNLNNFVSSKITKK